MNLEDLVEGWRSRRIDSGIKSLRFNSGVVTCHSKKGKRLYVLTIPPEAGTNCVPTSAGRRYDYMGNFAIHCSIPSSWLLAMRPL